jgi:sec-independent protein translocase protein TatC
MEHLRELRKRIVWSALFFAVFFVACFSLSDSLFAWLMTSVPQEIQARTDSLIGPFKMKVNIGLYFGAFLALPFMIFQGYAFVRPALRVKEDNTFKIFIGGGFFLLAGAIAFTHSILPYLIQALYTFVPQSRDVLIEADINHYISLILTIYLGFSILFQVPLVVFLSIFQGFVESRVYRENRKWVVVILLILCAIFSPPNVESMVLLFLPLYSLFEISVLLGHFLHQRRVRA